MRKLNAVCYPLYHELPLLKHVVDLVARNKANTLSVLDLRSAFYQLKISEDTADKTSFITPHCGSFKFLRLPMGLSQSPYYMSVALTKLFRFQIGSFLCVYLDDVLVASESPRMH